MVYFKDKFVGASRKQGDCFDVRAGCLSKEKWAESDRVLPVCLPV